MKRKRGTGRLESANTPFRSARTLKGILIASTVMGAAPGLSSAQATDARGQAQQPAASPLQFDIAAGALSDALDAFKRVTGSTLRVNAPIAGLAAKALEGSYASRDALTRLLEGTGLTFVYNGRDGYVIRPRGATVLREFAVNGESPVKLSSPKYTAAPVDLPRTVSVVSSEVIQAQAATNLRDIIRNVPGITINAGEGGGGMPGDNFNVRGFSSANDMFVDGVRDLTGYARESFNLEQVEVIKGPNSGVSGRGSTGGSINMVTKIPSLRAARSGNILLGSADQHRATVDVNQPLTELGVGGSSLRVNAVSSKSGVAGNDVVENESWGVAPSLSVGLGKPTQLTLSYLRSKQDNMPSYGVESFAGVPTVNTRRFFGLRSLDFEDISSSNTQARIQRSFGSLGMVRNQTTFANTDMKRIVTPVNPTTGARSPKTHISENTVFSNQTNLTLGFNTGVLGHDLVTGFEVSRESSMRGAFTIANRTFPVIANLNSPTADADYATTITPTVTRKVRATSLAAYAFETLRIGSRVELNGGLRWESYDPEYTDSASRAASVTTGITPRKATAVNGNAGVVIKPSANGSIYASYGTSFNPATENLSNDAISANSALPPERSRSYEVGAKWQLFKQRVLSSVALFRTEKTNARTSDPANPGLGTILAGKQRVDGGEASISGKVTRRWNVLGGYSHLSSEYVESLNPAQQGTSFTNVPKHTANIWSTLAATDKLQLGAGARYVDQRLLRIQAAGDVYVPSYHTYDAMASYRFTEAVGLQLNLFNLTDKLYYDSGRMWVPAAGRALSVTTNVKF